jgi:hypothetical protein
MNKHKLSILGFALVVLMASCKKMDAPFQPTHEAATTATATAAAPQASTTWSAIGNWNATKAEKYTTYNSSIQDKGITADVIKKGLVLVYKKDGESVHSLPYEQKGTADQYWYYQTAEGSITINVDAYGSSQNISSDATIRYFVVSEQQIKDFVATGKTKLDLLNLSYDAAAELFKK